MENQFFVDSKHLSTEALEKKHRLENDPSSRKNHMEYMPGMEQIESDVCANVMAQMKSYDYSKYAAKDVKAALEHENCTIEDFKALLSPAAEPFLEQMAQRARLETSKHFGNTVYLFTPLYIANYCENYCVYCGFNCYNHINRMKLSMEQIEREMKIIADSGMEEILILTGESRAHSDIDYIVNFNSATLDKLTIPTNAKSIKLNGEIEYTGETLAVPANTVFERGLIAPDTAITVSAGKKLEIATGEVKSIKGTSTSELRCNEVIIGDVTTFGTFESNKNILNGDMTGIDNFAGNILVNSDSSVVNVNGTCHSPLSPTTGASTEATSLPVRTVTLSILASKIPGFPISRSTSSGVFPAISTITIWSPLDLTFTSLTP